MRRILRFSLATLGTVGVVTGCKPETVIRTEDVPTAGVRFIMAVPDTAAMDMRFVDIVENNAHWNMAFRSNVVTTGGTPASTFVAYKATRAGSRHFRIFMHGNCTASACDQSYASTVVKDTTVMLEANKLYTALLWGYANPTGPNRPAAAVNYPMRLTFFEEAVADASPNVSIRVINAAEYPVDVRYYIRGATAPATPQWASVAPMSISTYNAIATDTIFYNVRAAGAATNLVATDGRALIGAEAIVGPPGPIDALPGTMVAGSGVTGIVFPRSVAGSQAPNVTTPSISFVWDRRPPRPAGI